MGGNHIESQRAVIALFWPAGAGSDGTATLVNITSRRLDVPSTTSALDRIKLKSKLKCFFLFSFFPPLILLARSKYIPRIHLTHLTFLPVCAYFGF